MTNKPKKIAILNHKGGVGKTATCTGLASALTYINPKYKILLIDADEQANLKTVFGIKLKDVQGSLADILSSSVNPSKCTTSVRENIDVILSGGKKIRDYVKDFANFPNAEKLMAERFSETNEYDYILIDCPPALSLVSSNVALYADYVVIPVGPDLLSFVAAKATVSFLEEMSSKFGHAPEILGVLPTIHDSRRNIDLDILDDLERLADSGLLHDGICFSEIRSDAKFKTAQVRRKLIHEAFPKSTSATDYLKFAKDTINKISALEDSTTANHSLRNANNLDHQDRVCQ